MILILNRVFLATGIAIVLCFGSIGCETEMLSASETAANDYGNFCPMTLSKLPVYIPHPDDCSRFFICDSGKPYLKECPVGLHFNRNLKACDYPEFAGCDTNSAKVPKGKMMEDEFTTCPAGNSKYPVLIPHPVDCSKFYICDSGSAHLQQCQLGLHFNPKVKACDYPEKAGCDTDFNEFPRGKITEDKVGFCPAENSKYPVLLPHPDDCSKFYICDSGLAHLKQCQPGLHFNPKIDTCDYPKNAGCNREMRMALSGVPSLFCPLMNGRTPIFYRHPTNCSVYYMCGNGLAYKFACPSRLHFNVRKKVCDYQRNSGCQNTNL